MLVEPLEEGNKEFDEFVDYPDMVEEVQLKEDNDRDTLVISFHALWGTEGCQTMRLLGRIKKQALVMLIDSESTHNFMDQSVAKRLKCPTQMVAGMSVIVANGEVLRTQEVCKNVTWESQGVLQTTNFLLLPLRGCDLVLGVQWLQTLGPITWDFNALIMRFTLKDSVVTLQGIQGGTVQMASKKQLSKLSVSRSP